MQQELQYNSSTNLLNKCVGNWYSWIPTNIGYLNFHYIADKDNLDNVFGEEHYNLSISTNNIKKIKITKTYLSDSNTLVNTILDKKEFYPEVDITFVNNTKFNTILDKKQPKDITGNIILSFKGVDPEFALEENDNIAKEYKRISAEFIIERTGKFSIMNVRYLIDLNMHVSNIEETKLTELTALYTLIKKVVHGDNHHYQKIDTMIGVYKQFVPKQILTDLGFYIKRLDKFLKSESNEIGMMLYMQDRDKIYSYAEGVKSYIDTFYILFKSEIESEDQTVKKSSRIRVFSKTRNKVSNENYFIEYSNIGSTVSSIKAKTENLKTAKAFDNKVKTFFFSLLAIAISFNILISSLTEGYNSIFFTYLKDFLSRDYLLVIIFISVLFLLRKDIVSILIQGVKNKTLNKKKYSRIESFLIYSYLLEDIKKKIVPKEYVSVYLKITNHFLPEKRKLIGLAISLIILGVFILVKFGL